MKLGRMVRLVVAMVLVATAIAVATTPTAVTAAKKSVKKLCPASRCQLKKAYDAKLLATRKALAKQYKVSFLASRVLPVLTLMNSRRCRDGNKIVQPVHICWKEKPSKAFGKAVAQVRKIIIRDEEERTGNCARCPADTFLFATACCMPECDRLRILTRLGKVPNAHQRMRACCAVHRKPCAVLKKNFKPKYAVFPTFPPLAPTKKTTKKSSKK